jgi:hypothetical protein
MHGDRLIQALRDCATPLAAVSITLWCPKNGHIAHHSELDSDRIWEEFRTNSSSGDSWILPAGAQPAVAYCQDEPRQAPLPPATSAQVAEVEHVLGHPMPELLRRMYTEIALGGFGPGWDGFRAWSPIRALPRREARDRGVGR